MIMFNQSSQKQDQNQSPSFKVDLNQIGCDAVPLENNLEKVRKQSGSLKIKPNSSNKMVL